MALNTVTLTWNLQDFLQAGAQAVVTIAPSVNVTDAADKVIVAANPRSLGTGATGSMPGIIATDNAGLLPSGWSYVIKVTTAGGAVIGPFNALISFANGATQDLSALVPLNPVPATLAYLPLPGGTAQAGQVPVATGSGEASSWGSVSGGASLPLTTLGDTLYENATPAPARLPGNTSTTRNFLTQAGTGSASAAPAWGTIAPSDLSVTFPWRFYADDPAYGAKGDGRVLGDVVTNGTAVITSATANFTAADVNKYILIHGANGTTSGPLITTIASRQSATQVTLASAASASVSNCPAVYGTDDTAAINSAVTAAGNYALANAYFAEVVFGAKVYCVAGLTQAGNGSTTPTFNAQIPLPFPAANGTGRKLVIALTGAGPADHFQYWESTTPSLAPTTLVSMRTAPSTPDATFGRQSVIGGPSSAAGFTGGFANVKPVPTNIMIMQGILGNETGMDFTYCAGLHTDGCSAHMFAPTGVNGGVQPYLKDLPPLAAFGNTASIGLIAPCVGNNADVTVPSFVVEGYVHGYHVADHFTGGRIGSIYTYTAVQVVQTVGPSGIVHTVSMDQLIAEVYNIGIQATGGTGTYANLDITMTAECTGVVADIQDTGNTLHGVVRWTDPADNRSPTVSGAANLKVTDCKNNGPGHWSGAPAVPGSTTPQQNTAWRDASIVVHTGSGVTVSAIAVDGVTTGLTMAASSSVTLPLTPAGKNVTLTYAGGTPTWDWWLA